MGVAYVNILFCSIACMLSASYARVRGRIAYSAYARMRDMLCKIIILPRAQARARKR